MSNYSFMGRTANRLCEDTRRFAYESLHGKYGTDAMVNSQYITMDDVEGFESMSLNDRFSLVINRAAEQAPIRIVDGELISGSANLGAAIGHVFPAKRNGEFIFGSVSHVTLAFDKVLKVGINGIEKEIDDNMGGEGSDELRVGLKNVVKAMRVWHKRYLDATTGKVHENLKRVPFEVPTTFYEAVQSLWFSFAFTRLCGNWPGIGRIDEMLGKYLDNDLKKGIITIDEAREILAHLFIKGCEWIQKDTSRGSGDAQHYQNLVLAGVDENGNEVTNRVTYLVLDIIEELGISDFPITIRVNKNTDEKLLARAAEIVRLGGGIIAFYNEDLILRSLTDYGYPLNVARRFANDGCWEVQIPGETHFAYHPFDGLRILLRAVLNVSRDYCDLHFDTYEELYAEYVKCLRDHIVRDINETNGYMTEVDQTTGKRIWHAAGPSADDMVVSLFENNCAVKGRSYHNAGTNYTVISPHLGGAADIANSLYAIKKLVFEEKKITYEELVDILRNNWEGNEVLRQYARNKYVYYGNANKEVDEIFAKVLNDFADIVLECNKEIDSPVMFIPGVSTFGRQIDWLPFRYAVPFGYKQGDILAGNASPTPGTDISGATGIIRSYCAADHSKQVCGAALDIILNKASVSGQAGVEAIASLVKGFCELGGYFLQMDTQSLETLLDAKENPDKYKTLSVRVSGWNARFVTLDDRWQEMIIERTRADI